MGWCLAGAVFVGCKWLSGYAWYEVASRLRSRPSSHPGLLRHIAYAIAWPGLDAHAFLGAAHRAKPVHGREVCWALAKLTLGLLLFLVVSGRLVSGRWLVDVGMPPVDSSGMLYVVGWVGMIGLVMSLHFGLFHVLSCVWRGVGIPTSINHRPETARPGTNRTETTSNNSSPRIIFATAQQTSRP